MAYFAIGACQEPPTAAFASRGLNSLCRNIAESIWRHVLRIRRIQASRSTSSKAYLAINAAHGLFVAFYTCHGSPYSLILALWLCAGFHHRKRTSTFAST
eukprot:1511179-Pleurochrysis_carterae.AAC.1